MDLGYVPIAGDKNNITQMTWYQKAAFYALVFVTAITLYLFAAMLDPNAEAKIVVGGIGGQALVFLSPLWLLYRRRIPLFAATLGVLLLTCGVILANCWAAKYAGTIYTHPSDYLFLWFYLVPGFVFALVRHGISKRHS